ncbi:CLUMA_CG004605, isoform A [Clunio marinus]|uniref:CLUMA_CG004605, isoform A n=1 Tax=Clunio marinus TaxID=568069 RepID=A0A1J1HU71_9DIPT|nr:CLUMA_CG004605, isoform A [Clunio marinus]
MQSVTHYYNTVEEDEASKQESKKIIFENKLFEYIVSCQMKGKVLVFSHMFNNEYEEGRSLKKY